MESTLRTLIDREEIRETILRWSRALDTKDWNLFDRCFTDDLVTDFSVLGLPQTDAQELKRLLKLSAESYFDFFQHVLSNLTFHTLSDDHARTSVMVSSYSQPSGGAMYQTNGWYHDELRRTADGWRICQRRFELIFNTSPSAGTAPAVQNG